MCRARTGGLLTEPWRIVLRAAVASDAGSAARLLSELGYPSSSDDVERRLGVLDSDAGHQVFVAELDGEVVGIAALAIVHVLHRDAPFARLTAIVVSPAARRRGIGERLLRHAEMLATEAGCRDLEVTSSRGDRRASAHRLYRRLGYDEMSEQSARFVKRLAPTQTEGSTRPSGADDRAAR